MHANLRRIKTFQNIIHQTYKVALILSPWIFLIGMLHYNFQAFYPLPKEFTGPQFFDFFTESDIWVSILILLFSTGILSNSIHFTHKIPKVVITAASLLLLSHLIQTEFQATYNPILVTPDQYFRTMVTYPAIYFFLLTFTCTKKDLDRITQSYIFMATTISALSLFQYFTNYFPGETTDFTGRLNWPYIDFVTLKQGSANWLAFLTTPAFVMSFIKSHSKSNIKIYIIPAILTGFVVYLTQSFGAYAAIFGAITLYYLLNFKKKKLFIHFIILLTIALGIAIIQKQSPKVQILQNQTNYKYESSVSSRKSIYTMALYAISQRPIRGVGLNQFQGYFEKYAPEVLQKDFKEPAPPPHAHNFFLSLWTSLGFFGFLAFAILIFQIAFNFKTNRHTPAFYALAGIMIHGIIDSYYWRQEIAYLVWFILALNYAESAYRLQNQAKSPSPVTIN